MTLSGTIGIVGQLFGSIALYDGADMINLDGPITIIRGDSVTYRITVTDENDARVDLTSYEIELQVKQSLGGADPAPISLAVGSGITLLDQTVADTEGQADAVITSALSAALVAGIYWIDVVAINGTNRQHVVAPVEFIVRDTVNLP